MALTLDYKQSVVRWLDWKTPTWTSQRVFLIGATCWLTGHHYRMTDMLHDQYAGHDVWVHPENLVMYRLSRPSNCPPPFPPMVVIHG